MKKSELLEKLKDIAEDGDIDETLKGLTKEEKPKTEIKSDTIIQMTAAEFLQLMSKKEEPKKETKKEEEDSDEDIYF